jgi:peptide-methionine (R)-S-oxide reductase
MSEASSKYPVQRSDAQWREALAPEEYQVLRRAATERPGTGELLNEARDGLYRCRACKNELFISGTKFDSGCGWPSFYESVRPDAVELISDTTLRMTRTEVRCAACGSHLGHVFPDGFGTPTGDRYCMNSLALSFDPGSPEAGGAGGADNAGDTDAATDAHTNLSDA